MRRSIAASAVAVSLIICACGGDGDADRTKTAAATARSTASPVSGQRTVAASPTAAPAIAIDAPAPGSTVRVPIDVRGRSDVFEGVLQVQLQSTNGTVLCERRVQSTSGTGTPGTWETTLSVPPPDSPRDAIIRAFSRSPRDGSEENAVSETVHAATDVPAIVILTPACNADIAAGSTLTVTGTASVFEAALTVELRTEDGQILLSQPVTADAAGPARGNWTVTLDTASLTAGDYEVTAFDLSARDGSRENEFSIPVRITV